MNKKQLFITLIFSIFSTVIWSQPKTVIRGYAHAGVGYIENNINTSFFVGEQDLFITSNITDRISFLGETVFKFSSESPTEFNVSIERLIIKYNFAGNHTFIIGKHHTPVSYWNDTYHHGRVFFPTVNRPLMLPNNTSFIEIHTTGIGIQGFNLGNSNFGYQFIVGNGIGSTDVRDDNKFKSLTLDLHLKPVKNMKFGITGYMDKFSSDARSHHTEDHVPDSLKPKVVDVFQVTNGVYFRYFKNKVQFLTEGLMVNDQNDSTGNTTNFSAYGYFGWVINETIVPYIKYDFTSVDQNEVYLKKENQHLLTLGIRYEFSHLAIAKLEYGRRNVNGGQGRNEVYFQFAVGF